MRVIQARAQSAQAVADQRRRIGPGGTEPPIHESDAPVSGAVSNRTVEVGQNLQTGQEMMKVIPLDEADIWVTANFKETQLKNIKPGQAVEIEVDATGKPTRTC